MQRVLILRRAVRPLRRGRLGIAGRAPASVLFGRLGRRSVAQGRINEGADLEDITALRQLVSNRREQLRSQILSHQFASEAADSGVIGHPLAKSNSDKLLE